MNSEVDYGVGPQVEELVCVVAEESDAVDRRVSTYESGFGQLREHGRENASHCGFAEVVVGVESVEFEETWTSGTADEQLDGATAVLPT